MRFEVDQLIKASPQAVVEATCDPDFYATLAGVPGVSAPEAVERTEDGDTVQIGLRFAFAGEVSGAVRAVVDPAKLTWVTQLTVHRAERTTEFVIVPDYYPDLMNGSGTYRLVAEEGGTRRITEGELVVRVPFFGHKAEQAIVDGFRRYLVSEGEQMETEAPPA